MMPSPLPPPPMASPDPALPFRRPPQEFCGLKEDRKEATFVTLRDAYLQQSGMPASESWVTLQSLGGQKKMELSKYISLLAAMRPDVAECLSDGTFSAPCHHTSHIVDI